MIVNFLSSISINVLMVVSLLVIHVLLIGLVLYVKTFIKKKAENLAQKQDLKELTVIVEDIKKANNKELELIRHELSDLNERRRQLFTEEKESIINYYAVLSKWLYSSLSVNLYKYNNVNFDEIDNKFRLMLNSSQDASIARARMELMVKDDEVINQGGIALQEILKYHHFTESKLIKLREILVWESIFVKQFQSYTDSSDSEREESVMSFFQTNSERLQKEKDEAIKSYFDEWAPIYQQAILKKKFFMAIAKKYLN